MHLLLPSGLNLFPRDLILAFQLTVCLYFSHLVFCLMHEKTRFSHFGSHPFSYLKMGSQTKFPACGGSRCCFCAVCDACICGVLPQAGNSLPFSMPGLQAGHNSGKRVARAWWAHLLLSAEGNNTYYFTSMFPWECEWYFVSMFIAHTTNGWMYVFDQISCFECPAYKSQIFATSSSQITA